MSAGRSSVSSSESTEPRSILPLTPQPTFDRLLGGGVPERTNGTASKAVRGLNRPSQVRILSPPQLASASSLGNRNLHMSGGRPLDTNPDAGVRRGRRG